MYEKNLNNYKDAYYLHDRKNRIETIEFKENPSIDNWTDDNIVF